MAPTRNSPASQACYWRRNVRLILALLAVWLLLAVAPALLTAHMGFTFIGWPFSFWLAAYGAPLSFLVIVVLYAWFMNRRDARAARPQDEERP
ncbi:DUF4212 domain-containing protein [Bordetella sp. 2513F-2]